MLSNSKTPRKNARYNICQFKQQRPATYPLLFSNLNDFSLNSNYKHINSVFCIDTFNLYYLHLNSNPLKSARQNAICKFYRLYTKYTYIYIESKQLYKYKYIYNNVKYILV